MRKRSTWKHSVPEPAPERPWLSARNGGRSNNVELKACMLPRNQRGLEIDQLPQHVMRPCAVLGVWVLEDVDPCLVTEGAVVLWAECPV